MEIKKTSRKVKPKRRKRKPFEPFVTMEAKGGGKLERTETPEQIHSRNRKKLSTNQEKELNKRLRAIGIGRK